MRRALSFVKPLEFAFPEMMGQDRLLPVPDALPARRLGPFTVTGYFSPSLVLFALSPLGDCQRPRRRLLLTAVEGAVFLLCGSLSVMTGHLCGTPREGTVSSRLRSQPVHLQRHSAAAPIAPFTPLSQGHRLVPIATAVPALGRAEPGAPGGPLRLSGHAWGASVVVVSFPFCFTLNFLVFNFGKSFLLTGTDFKPLPLVCQFSYSQA